MLKRVVMGALFAGLGSVVYLGCAGKDCGTSGTCGGATADDGSAGDANGLDGEVTDGSVNPVEGGNTVDAPPGCDLKKDPGDSPACIDEGVGVFVDGNSAAGMPDGTRKSPYKTIGDAVASNKRPRVYVCSGNYAENVKLDSTHAESVYGGFDCATWKYDRVANSVKVAPASGFALQIDTVVAALQIEDVEFDAPAGTAAGVSSVAAFVNASSAVTMKRTTLKAQDGYSPATPGAAASNYAANLDGNNAADTNGAATKTCNCVDATTSVGGRGGGVMVVQTTTNGTPSYSGGGGVGGTNMKACAGVPAGGGLDGDKASAPATDSAATKLGKVDPTKAWVGASGAKGKNGLPGQGGGGGADGAGGTGGGGSGGCGGCGGGGGAGGLAGGATVALLTIASAVVLVSCTLIAGAGATGAGGGTGEQAQAGGNAGVQFNMGGGCSGGGGGNGSGGNGGAGGAGGISFGLLFSGSAPTVDGVVASTSASHSGITVGSAGGSGATGAAGAAAASGGNTGNTGPLGPAGAAGAIQNADTL